MKNKDKITKIDEEQFKIFSGSLFRGKKISEYISKALKAQKENLKREIENKKIKFINANLLMKEKERIKNITNNVLDQVLKILNK